MKDKPDLNTNSSWLLKGILDLHDLLAFFFRQTPSAAFGAENRAFVGRKMCVLIAAQIRFFARVQIPLVNFWAHYKIVWLIDWFRTVHFVWRCVVMVLFCVPVSRLLWSVFFLAISSRWAKFVLLSSSEAFSFPFSFPSPRQPDIFVPVGKEHWCRRRSVAEGLWWHTGVWGHASAAKHARQMRRQWTILQSSFCCYEERSINTNERALLISRRRRRQKGRDEGT